MSKRYGVIKEKITSYDVFRIKDNELMGRFSTGYSEGLTEREARKKAFEYKNQLEKEREVKK